MPLRAAELEVLFTANTNDIARGEKDVKTAGERIEKKPIKAKVEVETKDALAGMARVESAANRFNTVFDKLAPSDQQRRDLIRGFLESERAGKQSAEQIEKVLTKSYGVAGAAAKQLAAAAKGEFQDVEAAGKKLAAQDVTVDVDADTADALAGMKRVEEAAKTLVSKQVAFNLDADISRAEKNLKRTQDRLEGLQVKALGGLDVRVETGRAEASISKTQRQLDALRNARTQIEIDADSAPAESAFRRVRAAAADAGEKGGDEAGEGLASGIISALVALPIAGSIIGAGVALGKAFVDALQDGLQAEAGRDRLQALTGISEADALRLGRTASEAYANGFGESIEANMDLTRLGVQLDIIDPAATNRDSQKVVEGLSAIADVLGEDVQPVARATALLLRTGLASSAQDAFDILATGAREGVNISEDLLDTLSEYGSTFASLGLSGAQSLGLLNQALAAGVPNTDFFADAIREFGLRVVAGEEETAGFISQLGLVPSAMQEAFAKGGPDAAAALDLIFDRLRGIQDPLEQNKIAVGLLGTQFEDLQFDVSKLDLSTAEAQLNGVQGSAQRMFDTLASNDASKIESALRSIEVAGDAVKGALAGAFGEGLGELATFVSENRGPVLQFLSDLVNGAIDFGQSMIEGAADSTEAFGEFVSGPGVDLLMMLGQIMYFMGQDTSNIESLITDMSTFDETTAGAADRIRGLSDDLEGGRGAFNEFFDPQIDLALLSDQTLALATAVDAVGYSVETGAPLVDAYTRATDGSVQAGSELEGQIRASIAALGDQIGAASAAGESQSALRGRFDEGTAALVNQLTQMGLTEQEARDLIAAYGAVPALVETAVVAQTADAEARIRSVRDLVNSIPTSKTVTVNYSQNGVSYSDSRENRRDGGPIFGPGGPRDDVVPIWASNGEHMLDADDVRNAGGHAGVFRLREALARGALKFADGGPIEQIHVPSSTWRTAGAQSDAVYQAMREQNTIGQQPASPASPQQDYPRDRPIMMDGHVFGILREQANGDARIIVADALERRDQNAKRGSWS